MFFKMCYNETNFVKGAQMRARVIDYSVYSEESLFMELDNTKAQLAKLESEKESLLDRKSQIEETLQKKAKVPNDETIKAMQECEKISQNDDIVEIDNVSNYLKGLVSNG